MALLLALTVRRLWCTPTALPVLEFSGATMGTTWVLKVAARDLPLEDRAAVRAAVEERLERVNALMSTWDPDSEVSRLNRHASTEPFRVSPETLEVLRVAQEVSGRSGGAFDVTTGPLVAAWGFGAGARLPGAEPDALELADLRERVGFELVEIDATAGTASKGHPGVECDLSAIAKGYAVDAVTLALEALDYGDFLIEVGGELRARGERPAGGPWRVAIEDPDAADRVPHRVISLADRAMATSGDYRSFYRQGGERVSHVIDPRTGRPVRHALASVTVVHESATRADAWATALAVLGPEEGPALAATEGLAAYFIVRTAEGEFRRVTTPAFEVVVGAEPQPPGVALPSERY